MLTNISIDELNKRTKKHTSSRRTLSNAAIETLSGLLHYILDSKTLGLKTITGVNWSLKVFFINPERDEIVDVKHAIFYRARQIERKAEWR